MEKYLVEEAEGILRDKEKKRKDDKVIGLCP